ncbi:MAG: hypothetical protein QMD85_04575 [Candidatus Aenigmarchaeota archaeon]|nr:hypothetical protein [Candidatus Aenigmarchaeota archaeon]MDI6722840.1 hypothetical protein [Candidatus Aenigmarchaeota archaeon]
MGCMKEKEANKIKERIIPILRRNDASKAGIFGSTARGEAKKIKSFYSGAGQRALLPAIAILI